MNMNNLTLFLQTLTEKTLNQRRRD